MSRRLAPLAAVATAAALAVAGCGSASEELIPEADATALRATLAQIEEARTAGNCQEARSLTQEARRQAEELPPAVDAELRRRIRGGISRIFELLPTQCDPAEDDEVPVTTAEPTEPAPPPTTEVPVTPTTQAPTQPPPTQTTPAPEEPEQPPPTGPGTGSGSGSGGSGSGGTGGTGAEEAG